MGDDRMRAARLRAICVEAELASGHTEQARADADELAALTADHALPVLQARTELARGRVAEASSETPDAVAAYQAGLRVLADDTGRCSARELHLSLGRLLAHSEAPAAIAETRAAHLIYERLGSPLASQSAQLLNSLGVPATVRPRRADATAALSRRESEVLDLLRDGLSNADIAARQHNSVRTIEHHVSAILAKLGLAQPSRGSRLRRIARDRAQTPTDRAAEQRTLKFGQRVEPPQRDHPAATPGPSSGSS